MADPGLGLDRPYLHVFDKTRYTRAYLWGGPLEGSVQADIVDALRISRIDVEVVDSGSKGLRGKVMRSLSAMNVSPSIIQAVMNALRGVAGAADAGRSDLSGVLAPNGRAFFLEVKAPAKLDPRTGRQLRPAGKPAPEQLDFLDRKLKEGAIVGVVWDVDDAFEVLGQGNVIAHQRSLR